MIPIQLLVKSVQHYLARVNPLREKVWGVLAFMRDHDGCPIMDVLQFAHEHASECLEEAISVTWSVKDGPQPVMRLPEAVLEATRTINQWEPRLMMLSVLSCCSEVFVLSPQALQEGTARCLDLLQSADRKTT